VVAAGLLLPPARLPAGPGRDGLALSRWDAAAQWLGVTPPPPVVQRPINIVRPQPTPPPQPVAQAEPTGPTQRLVIDPETVRRVNRLEQRLSEIALQSQAAAGNAGRAEGLLVAFAARRALDRGVSLGYLEGLLRQRFGGTQPAAVGTVITAARQPVTLEELQVGLQEVGPRTARRRTRPGLVGSAEARAFRHRHRAAERHPLPAAQRTAAARDAVARCRRGERGACRGAAHAGLSGRFGLDRKARRYVAARQALDTIETAALLDPRTTPTATAQAQLAAPGTSPAG
jgi:hypothetical protein